MRYCTVRYVRKKKESDCARRIDRAMHASMRSRGSVRDAFARVGIGIPWHDKRAAAIRLATRTIHTNRRAGCMKPWRRRMHTMSDHVHTLRYYFGPCSATPISLALCTTVLSCCSRLFHRSRYVEPLEPATTNQSSQNRPRRGSYRPSSAGSPARRPVTVRHRLLRGSGTLTRL